MVTLGIRSIGSLTTAYSTFSPIIKRSIFLRLCNTGRNENIEKLSFIILKEPVFRILFAKYLGLYLYNHSVFNNFLGDSESPNLDSAKTLFCFLFYISL